MLSGAGRTAGAATSPAPDAREALASARLARAAASRDESWRRALSALGVIVVGLLAGAFISRARIPGAEPATKLAPEAGAVSFDSSVLDDGRLHFFETSLAANAPARWNGAARFFAIRVGGEVRTNLDACQICGPIGYFFEGGAAVCRNCTSPIALGSLARGGGCNPIPVRSRVEGARVIVSVADIEKAVPLAKGR